MSSPDFAPEFPTNPDFSYETLRPQHWPQQWHASERFPTPQSVNASTLTKELSRATNYYDATQEYYLGNPDFPLAPYREHISKIVAENQITVLIGDTGSGKSSNSILYLLEDCYPKVVVTEPRILAARELMEFARLNVGEENEHLAGYLTGKASESDCPEGARAVYVTEDISMRDVNRGVYSPDTIFVIDEAHERGPGMIYTLALLYHVVLPQNPDMRLVVTSATIPAEIYSDYLGDAPIIEIEGRNYHVEVIDKGAEVSTAMRHHMVKNRNVLAFESGTGRMRNTWSRAQSGMKSEGHTVHMLHGGLSPRDQAIALTPDDGNHVVATRVAETSITPENKDVVVDSTQSNLSRYVQGEHILETVWSSKATMHQRMGRVGRTKPGWYERAVPADAPPPPPYDERPDYDPSPIENMSVASYLLELLSEGRQPGSLPLLESPTQENERHDLTMLHRLGAIAMNGDGDITVTDIGFAMREKGVDTTYARMLVEAERLAYDEESGSYDESLRLQVAAMVAVQQVAGIFDSQSPSQRYLRRKSHQNILSTERSSDTLFTLDTFVHMYRLYQQSQASDKPDREKQFDRMLEAADILPNRFYKAVATYQEICRREETNPLGVRQPDEAERNKIVACQIAGAEELFVKMGGDSFRGIRGERNRRLGRRSVVSAGAAELVVGTAFTIRGMRRSGKFEKRLISAATTVTTDQLLEHAPQRITSSKRGYCIDKSGKLVELHSLYFDDNLQFADVEQPLSPSIETRRALITAMMKGEVTEQRKSKQSARFESTTLNASAAINMWRRAQRLNQRSTVDFRSDERYAKLVEKVIRESVAQVPLDVTDTEVLDKLIPRVFLKSLVRPTKAKYLPEVLRQSPDAIELEFTDAKVYLPVTYRDNIAYVTIPKARKFDIANGHFDELLQRHDVKVRIANGKYTQLDVMIERIEGERTAEEKRRVKNAQREAEKAQTYAKSKEKEEYKVRKWREHEERERAKRAERLAARQKGSTSRRKAKRQLAQYALDSV